MRVLVIGGNGSMGRRYVAILKHLKEDVYFVDNEFTSYQLLPCFDAFVVATPTSNHFPMLKMLASLGKPVLCEKPLCQRGLEIEDIERRAIQSNTDIRMVCNWKYAINLAMTRAQKIAVEGEMEIEYNYFDSGKDGFFWDCIQLIHLAGRFKYDRTHPAFEAKVNGIDVTLEHIHASYVLMVSEWLHGDKSKLWNLEDALKATKKVKNIVGHNFPPETGWERGEVDFTKGVLL